MTTGFDIVIFQFNRTLGNCQMAKVDVDDNTRLLLKEASGYKILGKEAETACFKIYHNDSLAKAVREKAKLMVIESNLRFVLKFAMDYNRITGVPLVDLYAEGKLGLMDAFYRYDWRTGVKFGSYAVWYVRTHIGSFVQECDMVRVPVRLRKKVLKAIRDGEDISGMRYAKEAEAAILHTISTDTPVEHDDDDSGSITVGDTIGDTSVEAPDEEYGRELLRNRLDSEFRTVLEPSEAKLLRSLYGIDGEEYSLDDVAAETGSDKEWVRRAKARALDKLRDSKGLSKFTYGIS